MNNSYELDYQETIILEQEMKDAAKSSAVGCVAALLLGGFGIHRFYLDDIFVGVIFFILGLVSIGLSLVEGVPSIIGYVPVTIGLIETIFMPARVKVWNDALETKITKTIICERTATPVHPKPDDAAKGESE